MLKQTKWLGLLLAAAGAALGYVAATAQQGAPPTQPQAPPLGSPAATTTIDGRYLPNPPQPFKGEINLNAYQSKP